MGSVDIADQLRGVYRLDRFVRNRKWWWSILFWSLGVLLTNAYKLYLSVCENAGVAPTYKQQYEFRKAIAEYWINPELISSEISSSGKKRSINELFDSSNDSCSVSGVTNPFLSPAPSLASEQTIESKSARISDSSLDERKGLLRKRLDTLLDHLPEPARKAKPRCGLHHWLNKRKEAKIAFCPTCRVHLCLTCYGMFHRIGPLVSMKTKLKKDLK